MTTVVGQLAHLQSSCSGVKKGDKKKTARVRRIPDIPRLSGGQHVENVENGATSALTPRQRELAGLIAQGLTNREIAQGLGISVFTVRHHVSHVLRKLKVKSRAQVAFLVGQQQNNKGGAPFAVINNVSDQGQVAAPRVSSLAGGDREGCLDSFSVLGRQNNPPAARTD